MRRSRGAFLRAAALAALFAALLNPTLRQEERDHLPNIAIVVVDESSSQTLAKRPEQTRSHPRRSRGEARQNLQPRGEVGDRRQARLQRRGKGTQLFAELNKALADTPPDRLAGVILVTDGQVHDVPKQASALGFDAPVHALLTGAPGEFDRRIEALKVPRYGLVGQSRDIEIAVRETGEKGRRARRA